MDIESNGNLQLRATEADPGKKKQREVESLPRVDGGKDAWTVLAGAFVLEAVVWGFPLAFGVFQEYYSTHEPFASQPSGIPAISTTATGIMYLASSPLALLLQRYPRIRRPLSYSGLVITSAALIGASFANSTGVLLATQGVLYAIGGLMLYFPAMFIIDEWFVAKKGFAFGVAWTGTGTSGAIVPFLMQWLLDQYGFRTALRVWTVVMIVLTLPATMFMKNRIPPSQHSTLRPKDLSFIRKPAFWIFQLGNFVQSLGFFLPLLWIPSFASNLGFPSFTGALALCLLNIGVCAGYLLNGFLVDHVDISRVLLLSTVVQAIAIFVFWGLTTSQSMLYIFALLWGVSGGGISATWSGCARAMERSVYSDKISGTGIDHGLVIGLMCAAKGVASLITGPVSEQLLKSRDWHGAGFAYGGAYGPIILFAGVTVLFTATPSLGKLFKLVK